MQIYKRHVRRSLARTSPRPFSRVHWQGIETKRKRANDRTAPTKTARLIVTMRRVDLSLACCFSPPSPRAQRPCAMVTQLYRTLRVGRHATSTARQRKAAPRSCFWSSFPSPWNKLEGEWKAVPLVSSFVSLFAFLR